MASTDKIHINKRLEAIQLLRAFAAVVVLASHAAKETSRSYNIHSSLLDYIAIVGQFGVDVFFVISGVIMVYVSAGDAGSIASAKRFIVRRIVRLVPLYWIFTTIAIAVSLLASHLRHHNETDPYYILSSYLFLPALREDGHVTPALGVGWTLNYEMLFYGIFALCMAFTSQRVVLVLLSVLTILVLVGQYVPFTYLHLWYWTRPIILEFGLGAAIGYAYLRGVRVHSIAAYGFALVGIAVWLIGYLVAPHDPTDTDLRIFVWGIPAAMTVSGVVLARTQMHCLLPAGIVSGGVLIGDASYSLYLSHMFLVRAITIIVVMMPATILPSWHFAASNLVSIVAAVYIYRYIETPIIKAFQNAMRR